MLEELSEYERSHHLWCKSLLRILPRFHLNDTAIDNACRVDHPMNSAKSLIYTSDHLMHLLPIGHIGLHNENLCPKLLKNLHFPYFLTYLIAIIIGSQPLHPLGPFRES